MDKRIYICIDLHFYKPFNWPQIAKLAQKVPKYSEQMIGVPCKYILFCSRTHKITDLTTKSLPSEKRKHRTKFHCTMEGKNTRICYPKFHLEYVPMAPDANPRYDCECLLKTNRISIRVRWSNHTPPSNSNAFAAVMQQLTTFVHQQGGRVIYGNVRVYAQYFVSWSHVSVQKKVPDDLIMTVCWGNILTAQQLGSDPAAVKAAINQTIAPNSLKEVAPGIYWFQLPYDMVHHTKEQDPALNALRQKTIDALKPFGLIYGNGKRRLY